jgi:hypothetical protein
MSVWHYVVCQTCRHYVNLEKTDWYCVAPSDFEGPLHATEVQHAQRALYFVRLHNGHPLMLVNEFEFEQYADRLDLSSYDDFEETT